ncbi:MAG: nucleoside triphosphate pyrophosphohydrolase [Chitinophagia bacterium]|nr:nucleoside triphosphate pyrophosphohydrolase [Chitinophagia bacterium]
MTQTLPEKFLRLKTIMDELRERCPWDRKQTVESLRTLTIEETYELADAIAGADWDGIREELGDMLLHIVFYARIGREQGRFTLEEVIDGICDKLVKRHPHIYGDIQVADEEEVKRNWEKLKMKEGKTSVLGGVPASLPAMVKAVRLQEKAAQVGFEWEEPAQVWEKVREEEAELQQALVERAADSAMADAHARVEEEFGDLLFSLVNYSRFIGVDPEMALERTNRKFSDRFRRMEALALGAGKPLQELTLAEMDAIWDEVKKASGKGGDGGGDA